MTRLEQLKKLQKAGMLGTTPYSGMLDLLAVAEAAKKYFGRLQNVPHCGCIDCLARADLDAALAPLLVEHAETD